MRKNARASIVLIAVGVLLIVEAYVVPSGGRGSYRVVTASPQDILEALFLFRGQTVEGNISASAPVNFYVMDEANYVAFAKGNSWQPLAILLNASNGTFSFVAPETSYYRTIAVVGQSQKNAGLDTEIKYYGANLDYYQSGLVLVTIGAVLIGMDALLRLRSRNSKKPPAE